MAIAIRSIPTLHGKDAERFIAKAEEAEKNTKQRINVSRNIKLVKDFLRKKNLKSHNESRRTAFGMYI